MSTPNTPRLLATIMVCLLGVALPAAGAAPKSYGSPSSVRTTSAVAHTDECAAGVLNLDKRDIGLINQIIGDLPSIPLEQTSFMTVLRQDVKPLDKPAKVTTTEKVTAALIKEAAVERLLSVYGADKDYRPFRVFRAEWVTRDATGSGLVPYLICATQRPDVVADACEMRVATSTAATESATTRVYVSDEALNGLSVSVSCKQ